MRYKDEFVNDESWNADYFILCAVVDLDDVIVLQTVREKDSPTNAE